MATYLLANDGNAVEPGVAALSFADPLAANSFPSRSVLGESRTVAQFSGTTAQQAGASLNVAGLITTTFTIELVFRYIELATFGDGFRRLVDTKDGGSDSGLYANAQKLVVFESGGSTFTPVGDLVTDKFADGAFYRLFVRNNNGTVSIFLNGSPVSFGGSGTELSTSALNLASSSLRFFLDDGGEYSNSELAFLRLYDTALSNSEIATVNATSLPSQSAAAIPEPGTLVGGLLPLLAAGGYFWGRRRKSRRAAA